MNATQAIVAVGKLTGTVASPTTIAPSVAPTRLTDHAGATTQPISPTRSAKIRYTARMTRARSARVLTATASTSGNSAKAKKG